MIQTYVAGRWVEVNTLIEAFGISPDDNPVFSIVGGGGKTTTSRRLMKEFYEAGKAPIVTTTTHMQKEETSFYVGEEKMNLIKETLKREGKVWTGVSCGETMMKSFSLPFVSELSKLSVPLIIEADGAKMMPCKVPSEKEPVIIPETSHIIAVYGMDAVGRKLEDSCFRIHLVTEFLNKTENDILTVDDIVKIAGSEAGGKKHLSHEMEYQVILNKADDELRQSYATEIAKGLAASGIKKIYMTSFLMGKDESGGR